MRRTPVSMTLLAFITLNPTHYYYFFFLKDYWLVLTQCDYLKIKKRWSCRISDQSILRIQNTLLCSSHDPSVLRLMLSNTAWKIAIVVCEMEFWHPISLFTCCKSKNTKMCVCAPRRCMWGKRQCVRWMASILTAPTMPGWRPTMPSASDRTAKQWCSRPLTVGCVCCVFVF